MLPECSLVGRMAIQGLSKSWGYLKAPQPELPMSLALEPPLAAHLPEIVATMTRATERLQVIAGTVGRNMVQMSHRQQKPPGNFWYSATTRQVSRLPVVQIRCINSCGDSPGRKQGRPQNSQRQSTSALMSRRSPPVGRI